MKRLTQRRRATSLAIAVSGGVPPDAFRIFSAGVVDTTKGKFTFDEVAAASVMAEYTAHGIDLMIDYDHASLATVSLDPAESGKAAGWFKLEVRNGELWAASVRWAPPAAEALSRSEWRFVSPAFSTDEDGRITSLLNVAITNLPATRRLEPLMAASAITTLGDGMDPKLITDALDALIAGDAEKCAELLKGIIAGAAGAEVTEAPGEEAPPAPVEMMAPSEEEDDDEEDMSADKPAEIAAALSVVSSLSGKASIVASVADIRTWHASHVTLATEREGIAKREAVLESAERRKLCVELVTLGGRAPSAVWADDSAKTPKAYLLSMPIADLRAMHADEIKASGGKPRPSLKVPNGGAAVEALSAREIAMCVEMKIDPKTYAAQKAATTKAKG